LSSRRRLANVPAAALLEGEVMPAQFGRDRVIKPDVHEANWPRA
jgi:hypothetical protein